MRTKLLPLLALAVTASIAKGSDLPPAPGPAPAPSPYTVIPPSPPMFEIRLGAFAHDFPGLERGTIDVNGEFLWAPWGQDSSGFNFLIPRLHVGTSINTGGKTNVVYAGFTWTYDITRALFAELTFGGSVNDGKTGVISIPGRNGLGCHELFRESIGVGYRLTSSWSIIATADHMSNAGLCSHNKGLTNAGARLGYSF